MKRIALSSLAALLLAGSALYAEPSADFGVNHTDGPITRRVKHTDSFGDTYYTYTQKSAKKSVAKEVHQQSRTFKKASNDILVGLTETLGALEALQKKNDKLVG